MTDQRVSARDMPLTRRQMREQGESGAPARRSFAAGAGRLIGRLALVGALAATTWVVPTVGLGLGESEDAEPGPPPLADASALDVLTAPGPDGGDVLAADALQADPLAQSRAILSASRNAGGSREPVCNAPGVEANGTLAAEVESVQIDLVMPLPEGSYRLTSPYGYRTHPIFGRYVEHTGTDMAAPTGTPIHAIADGVVTHAGGGRDGRSGQLIIIQHEIDGAPVWSWYVHMYPNGVYVNEGQHVRAGELIGAVGSYGYSTGPHLHLEIHIDDQLTTVDPRSWLEARNAAPMNAATAACAGG